VISVLASANPGEAKIGEVIRDRLWRHVGKEGETMILAGDIGGTKTNLALFTPGAGRPQPVESRHLATADYPSPEAIIADFLRGQHHEVKAACLALAGPVVDGRCRFTNLPWRLSAETLARRFGWQRCRLLNDVEATAHALPLLAAPEFEALRPPAPAPDGNLAIMAPGTGLGMGLAIQLGSEVIPLASEGGHADFAPIDEETVSLWRYIQARRGRVTLESVLSGAGLQRIYQWRRHLGETHPDPKTGQRIEDSDDPPAQISALAIRQQDPVCVRALACFVRCLGAAAGNLALTATTRGGIYLAGGIAPKILPALKRGGFTDAFLDKGRFRDFLTTVPVRVILTESAPVLGAARVALAWETEA
jgi:glucokinase